MCGTLDGRIRGMNMIINLAGKVAGVRNRELRDLAAYVLDEVHSWRCGIFAKMDECDAVAMAFSDPGAGDERSRVGNLLQPISEFSGWYVVGPIHRRIATLQEWDNDDLDAPARWRWSNEFVGNPLKMWPGFRSQFKLIAKFAAGHTWYSADQFIAEYIVAVVPRLAADMHGYTMFFADAEDEHGEEMVVACYKYSLGVLADMARNELEMDGVGREDWTAALAEAINLGMLWD